MRHHHHRNNKLKQLHEESSFKKSSTDKTLHPGNNEQRILSVVDTWNHAQQSRTDDHNDERRRLCSKNSNNNNYSGDDIDDDEWSSSNGSSWQSFVHHDRLKGQTTDPDALRWDKAVDSFRWGVQQVRKGCILQGAVAICTSLLMDARAYKACRRLPPQNDGNDEDEDGKRQQEVAADCLLDESVAQTLLQHQKDHVIIQLCASMIVAMRTEQWKGPPSYSSTRRTTTTTTTPFSQEQQILRMIDTTKNILAQRPNIVKIDVDNHGDNACWSMEHWHYWWAMRYLAVDRDVYWQNALVELTRALEHNSCHTRARYHAALLYSQYKNDDHNATETMYEKWKNYIQVAHFDHYYLHDAYTWMAYLVLEMNNNNNSDNNNSIISDNNNDIDDDCDQNENADADADTNTTTTNSTTELSLFSIASNYLQASDAALRRHVNLYNFVDDCQPCYYMLWYSSNHYDHDNNTTADTIMKKKAKAVARLRSHPDQKPWIKYWTASPPPRS